MATKKAKAHVLLLHGLGGSAADWHDVAAILKKSYDVLAPDLPGAGPAAKPADGYDPASLATFVLDWLAHHHVPHAFVAGHSLGARVAGELAATDGRHTKALALVAPLGASSYALGDKLKWKAMSRRAILEGVPESSMRKAAAYGFVHESAARSAFVERTIAARKGKEGSAALRAVEKSVDGILDAPPLSERLRGTKVPLLVVRGAKDPLVPADSLEPLKRARPDAQFVEIPRTAHYPMLEDPKAVAAALREFFG